MEHTEAAAAAAASQAAASEPPTPRFAGALDWCEGLEALIATLGGVRLEAATREELRLQTTVAAEATWEPTPSASGAWQGCTSCLSPRRHALTRTSALHHATQCLNAS